MRLERTLFICLHPFTKTHIHLNDITYHIDQQKEPREGHSHRPSSEMVPSTYRRLSRQSLPQGSAYKGSQVSRCPPWEPGTCVKMAIRAPASLSPQLLLSRLRGSAQSRGRGFLSLEAILWPRGRSHSACL